MESIVIVLSQLEPSPLLSRMLFVDAAAAIRKLLRMRLLYSYTTAL